jgi:hypothetical protein
MIFTIYVIAIVLSIYMNVSLLLSFEKSYNVFKDIKESMASDIKINSNSSDHTYFKLCASYDTFLIIMGMFTPYLLLALLLGLLGTNNFKSKIYFGIITIVPILVYLYIAIDNYNIYYDVFLKIYQEVVYYGKL